MSSTIAELDRRRTAARMGGGQKRIDAQHAKGRLTARERLDVLLDERSGEPALRAAVEAARSGGRTDLDLAAPPGIRPFALAALAARAGRPVLAVTAYAGKGDDERIRDAGADSYLAKPVSIGPFMMAVKALIEKTPAGTAP